MSSVILLNSCWVVKRNFAAEFRLSICLHFFCKKGYSLSKNIYLLSHLKECTNISGLNRCNRGRSLKLQEKQISTTKNSILTTTYNISTCKEKKRTLLRDKISFNVCVLKFSWIQSPTCFKSCSLRMDIASFPPPPACKWFLLRSPIFVLLVNINWQQQLGKHFYTKADQCTGLRQNS